MRNGLSDLLGFLGGWEGFARGESVQSDGESDGLGCGCGFG